MTPDEAAELPEVRAAAAWWANVLRRPPIDHSGDIWADMFKHREAKGKEPLTEDTLLCFEVLLRLAIGILVVESEWRPWQPEWGSYIRCINNDYSPAKALEVAAQTAGIRDLYFRVPWKAVMWINPGSVTVAEGRGAQPQTIYHGEPSNA